MDKILSLLGLIGWGFLAMIYSLGVVPTFWVPPIMAALLAFRALLDLIYD